MKKLYQAAAIAAVMFMLSGCAAQGALDHAGTNLVVRAGVAEFVDGKATTAQSVIDWTDDALEVLDGNPVILVEHLRDEAEKWIPWDRLSGGQRIIAVETLVYVERQLTAGIETGELPPDATVRLRDLIETARWQASFELRQAQ